MSNRAKLGIGIAAGVTAAIIGIAAAGFAVFNQHFKYIKPTWNYTWKDNGDIEKIRVRMLEDLYDSQADPSECLSNLNQDGSFKHVDYYTDKKDTWHPAQHLDNILLMQTAAYTPGNPYHMNTELIDGITKAITFWVEQDFVCEWNGLGVGPKIADILLFPNKGIPADMSFQQHYELLYLGGYGEVFCNGMNRFIRYTTGTQYALSETALTFYQDFLLNGMQYAMRGEYRDINASGRGIVRENELVGICRQVIEGCKALLNSGFELSRADEMRALLETRGENGDVGAGGHRYFWNSDYQVYNGQNYMASVRAASTRTKNSEALNGENVWGHYLGAGATMYYVDGDEYFNIFPLWDWNKIPGTTAVQGFLPYGDDRTYSRMGKTSFVGGVSDGSVGMSCLKYRDNGVRAKKAWFMTGDGVMCLGTDISASKKADLYTTMNQNLLRDDIVYSINGAAAQTSEMQQTATFDWIYNNGIGYITDAPVTVNAGARTGDWKKISERVDRKIHTDSVFEVGISHGEKPRDASYEYFVMMNTTPQALQNFRQNPIVTVLSNNEGCQAVYDQKSGNVMAVFWDSGKLKLPNGEILKVSDGCTLLCQQTENGFALHVSNPIQNGGTIKISVGEKAGRVDFPEGMYAGDSKKIEL